MSRVDDAWNAHKCGFDLANEKNRNTLENPFVNAHKQGAVTGPVRPTDGEPVKCAVCGGAMRIERAPGAAGGANRLHCTCGHCEDLADLASQSASNREAAALPDGMHELP